MNGKTGSIIGFRPPQLWTTLYQFDAKRRANWPVVRQRCHGWKLAAVKPEFTALGHGTVTGSPWVEQLLPGAVLRVVQEVGAALKVRVHVQHQLVPLGTHVHQLLVERVLEVVDSVGVGLDAGAGQAVARLHRGDLCASWHNRLISSKDVLHVKQVF